jgi:site-specific recombinase XerC
MSEYFHSSLLSPEQELKLRDELSKLWNEGKTGTQIAQTLGFGDFGTKGSVYSSLKPEYVGYFRWKFNKFAKERNARNIHLYKPDFFLPPRHSAHFSKAKTVLNKKGVKRESRYQVEPNKTMSPKDFVELLNKNLPKEIAVNVPKRSLLICMYWSGLRISELLSRQVTTKDRDFEITETEVIVHLKRKKKREKGEGKDSPVYIPRVFPLVSELVEYIESKSWETRLNGKPNEITQLDKFGNKVKVKGKVQKELNHRVWQITRTTAETWTKQFYQTAFPHYFRYNTVMSAMARKDFRVSELKGKLDLSLSAIEHYAKTQVVEQRKLNDKMINEMKEQGLI